jgi:N-methylhydantoinase B/oxoprolinase/acetone carboxylase alpha subunit
VICIRPAVVAGNVVVCYAVTGTLFGALAAAQGTMKNVNFGNARYQYYETICLGSPAGPGFPGTDAVRTIEFGIRRSGSETHRAATDWRHRRLAASSAS